MSLAAAEHDDLSVAEEAKDEIERLRAALAEVRSDRDFWKAAWVEEMRKWVDSIPDSAATSPRSGQPD